MDTCERQASKEESRWWVHSAHGTILPLSFYANFHNQVEESAACGESIFFFQKNIYLFRLLRVLGAACRI